MNRLHRTLKGLTRPALLAALTIALYYTAAIAFIGNAAITNIVGFLILVAALITAAYAVLGAINAIRDNH